MRAIRTEAPESSEQKEKNYIELHVPKLPKFSLQNRTYAPFLVALLVIASFLLGMLTTKVQYLEKQVNGSTTATVQGATAQTNTAGTAATPAPRDNVKVDIGSLPSLGDKNAKVTIVEFSDFQCPFCKQFFDNTFAQLKKDYIDTGKVVLYYRHYPLPFHPNAQKAAEAAECANDQGKFWEYHDTLFKNQDSWANQAAADAAESFTKYAGDLGLDTATFSDCVSSGKNAQKVKTDSDAGTAVGVNGTPTFYINGRELVGAYPYASFQEIIDAKLK